MEKNFKLPSVVMPQQKYYRAIPPRKVNTQQTVYDLVFESNKNNMDWPAIKYLSDVWTFGRLKMQTDQLADAFVKAGVESGETVLIGLTNCIEAVLSLLALNKIGAVSKWIDMRVDENDIKNYINTSHSRFFIAFDVLVPIINKIEKKDVCLEKIITVSPVGMLSAVKRTAYSIKQKLNNVPEMCVTTDIDSVSFKDFIQTGNPNADVIKVEFNPERPSIVIQSSGTTGKPKNIVHSDFSVTSGAWSLTYSDMPVEPGKTVLVMLPPWIAYSLGQAILYPLSVGANVILDPGFMDVDALIKHLKENFTISFGVPHHYRYLLDNFHKLSPIDKKRVYSAELFVTGGDKISPEENKDFDDTFRTPVVNGYGNNENWGCITVNCTLHNRYGSVGIPKYGDTIISYDNDRDCELPFNEVGEICIQTNTSFLYYADNMEMTQEVKRKHGDGKEWIHTGDLGIIDDDGFVFLKGRIRRIIIRYGFKISAYTIEDAITALPMVKECVAVQVKDADEGGVPMVFIVLNDSFSDLDKQTIETIIHSKCQKDLREYEIPKYIQFRDELPITSNRKYDFVRLENEGNEYVDSLG